MVDRRRRVVWTEQAQRAPTEAAEYIALDSEQAAAELVERLLKASSSLEHLSSRARSLPELARCIKSNVMERAGGISRHTDQELEVSRTRLLRTGGHALRLVVFVLAGILAVRFVIDTVTFRGWSPGAFFGLLLVTGAIALVWRATIDLRKSVRRLRT